MNAKIFVVIQQMLNEPDNIGTIVKDNSEYYFTYKAYNFSIMKDLNREPIFGPYSFYVYPKYKGSLQELIAAISFSDAQPAFISYHTPDFEDSGYAELLPLLFSLIEERYLDLDNILDDILDFI